MRRYLLGTGIAGHLIAKRLGSMEVFAKPFSKATALAFACPSSANYGRGCKGVPAGIETSSR